MPAWFFVAASWLITSQVLAADEGQRKIDERLLLNRLNNLESQSIQRRGREPTTVDLLNRQADKVVEQSLNSLKTRDIRNRHVPLLKRKLDRSRRPAGVR